MIAVPPQDFGDALQVALLGGLGVEREDHTLSRLPQRARPGAGVLRGTLEEALRQAGSGRAAGMPRAPGVQGQDGHHA